jgi:hypothetical protein
MPQNETSLDYSYLPCFEKFSEMKLCFFENRQAIYYFINYITIKNILRFFVLITYIFYLICQKFLNSKY